MSSKRRIRRNRCERKQAFPGRIAALTAAVLAMRQHGGEYTPYACRWCGQWHIGHTPLVVRQAMAARRQEA